MRPRGSRKPGVDNCRGPGRPRRRPKEQLRARFKAWAAEAIETENPRTTGATGNNRHPFVRQTSRYRYFVQVDEEALQELVGPGLQVHMLSGHVNFFDSEGDPDLGDNNGM